MQNEGLQSETHPHTHIHTYKHTYKQAHVTWCTILYNCLFLLPVGTIFVCFILRRKVGKKGVIFVKETRPLNIDIVKGKYFPATLKKKERTNVFESCNFVSSVLSGVSYAVRKVYSVLEVY